MRKYIKQISLILASILCILCVNETVFAENFSKIDLGKKGSVSVTLLQRNTNKAISKVPFALYNVGNIEYSGNSLGFVYNEKFENAGMTLNDLQAEGLADYLADYAAENNISGETKKTDEQGKIVWDNLELGLYLVVQTENIQGKYTTEPFLVSVPIRESNGEGWIYNVDASPKIGALPDEKPEKPTTPETPSLIQTGQLNWPIPLLAGSGVVIFAIGWMLTFMKRKEKNEK